MSIGFFRTATASLLAAVVMATALDAGATSMVAFDDEDLTHIADSIVVGEVESVVSEVRFEPSIGGRTAKQITTKTVVKVLDAWKGPQVAGDRVVIRELGGVSGKEMMVVDGTSGYLVGERVLVFLQYRPQTNEYGTVGWVQGKFTLLPNGANGWNVGKLRIPVEQWGRAYDAAKDGEAAVVRGFDLASFATKVKRVVKADAEAGIHWRQMPKYKGIAR